jgi:hypothetical protein
MTHHPARKVKHLPQGAHLLALKVILFPNGARPAPKNILPFSFRTFLLPFFKLLLPFSNLPIWFLTLRKWF